jgi:hypothetical protein
MVLRFYDYLNLGVVVVGLLGNVASLIVCSRSKLQKTVFATYFRCLALLDSFNLVVNPLLLFVEDAINLKIDSISTDFCRLRLVLYYFASTSGWIMVAISVDRLLSIKFPSRFLFRKEKCFQVSVCLALILKFFLVYPQIYFQPTMYDFEYPDSDSVHPNATTAVKFCAIPVRFEQELLSWIDLFNATILPFVLMLTCTLLMLVYLVRSRRNSGNRTDSSRHRQRTFAINAISINLIFFLTNLPLALFLLYDEYFPVDVQLNFYISGILLVWKYVNFGSSFYVNMWVNSIFRQEFMALVSFGSTSVRQSSSIATRSIPT